MFFPLVIVVPEGINPVIFIVVVVPGFLNCHVSRDSFSFNSDTGGSGKESIRTFRQFSSPDFSIGTEKAVAAPGIQTPGIGAFDTSFSEVVGLSFHFLLGSWLFMSPDLPYHTFCRLSTN